MVEQVSVTPQQRHEHDDQVAGRISVHFRIYYDQARHSVYRMCSMMMHVRQQNIMVDLRGAFVSSTNVMIYVMGFIVLPYCSPAWCCADDGSS